MLALAARAEATHMQRPDVDVSVVPGVFHVAHAGAMQSAACTPALHNATTILPLQTQNETRQNALCR